MSECRKVEWLLDCDPRPVQLEALRRSFYGFRLHDTKEETGTEPIQFRDGPAKRWAHFLQMRLGKTPTALNEWLLFLEYHGTRRLVVTSPYSYVDDWVTEVSKFGILHHVEKLILKKGDAIVDSFKDAEPGILVVHYETFQHEHGARQVMDFMQGQKCGLIYDESIKLKNPNSPQTIRAFECFKHAAYTRPMTGRPMTQGPTDLYMQLRVAGALEGKNFYAFRGRYCQMGGYKNKAVKGTKNEEELNQLIQSVGFLAKRVDWANTIDADYQVKALELHPKQVPHYKSMEKEYYVTLDDDTIDVDQVITQWMKLQQISSGFIYDEHKETKWLLNPSQIPKVKFLEELFESLEGKMVVGYHYDASGRMLLNYFKALEPAIIGGRSLMHELGTDTISQKSKFTHNKKCRVIFVQLDAGKYGHDLTGAVDDRAALFAYYENTPSLDTRIQSEARITTSQQDWPVVYCDMVSSEAEKKHIDALIRKQSLEEAILGNYGDNRWTET